MLSRGLCPVNKKGPSVVSLQHILLQRPMQRRPLQSKLRPCKPWRSGGGGGSGYGVILSMRIGITNTRDVPRFHAEKSEIRNFAR